MHVALIRVPIDPMSPLSLAEPCRMPSAELGDIWAFED
jgi:hypothetical protein